MKTTYMMALCAAVLAGPVMAEGDVAKGDKGFNKCKSCHMLKNDAGDVVRKGGKTGPSLYGIAGRAAGSVEGFKYSKSLLEAGEKGLVWDAENFAEYTKDPKAFLKAYLDDPKAKSKMTYKLKKGAEDVYAYLASITE